MPYAARADLIARFDQDEIQALAPGETAGSVNNEKINTALGDAEALINSYLGQRYTLPIDGTSPMLKAVCCDLARYNLYDNQAPDEVTARNTKAISWLRDVASNRASLGITPANSNAGGFAVAISGGGRSFTKSTLSDY